MNWGLFEKVGVFLAKVIVGINTSTNTGPQKSATVQGLLQTFLAALAGDSAATTLMADPEVLAKFHEANDAIVAFQNVLETKHAALPPQP